MATERFTRELGTPRLAEAPSYGGVDTEVEIDTSELLSRLERHAAESGRLEGRLQSLEDVLEREREARRKLAETLKRERKAAKALHQRAQRAEEANKAAAEEIEQLQQTVTSSEQQLQLMWARLVEAEGKLAWKERSVWRKMLRRPPAG
jgi:septation ring formation regulator EzrA